MTAPKTAPFVARAALVAMLTFSPAAFAQDAKVLAKVGETEITQTDLDQIMKDMAQQFGNYPEGERKARALDALIDITVLANKARATGVDKTDELKNRIKLLTDRALHNGYFSQKIESMVDDEKMKARFAKEVASTPPEKEVSARHILVKTEEEAKAIVKELEGGADFVELAKAKSTGPSGPKGGDLGFFGKGRMVPAFESAAFALDKGKFTKRPVKTQFGYHIIKVDDKRDVPVPTFEQSKQQLRQVMLTEAYAAEIKSAREEYKVELFDESLKLK